MTARLFAVLLAVASMGQAVGVGIGPPFPEDQGGGLGPATRPVFEFLAGATGVDNYSVIGASTVTFGRAGAATYVDDSGVIQSASAGEARFEANGALVENAIANQLLRSEELDLAWTPTNCASVSTDTITAPDGASTADACVANTTAAAHYVTQALTTAGTGWHTLCAFVQAGDLDYAALQMSNAPNTVQYYDAANCAVGTSTTGTPNDPTATAYANGWCRICMSEFLSSTTQNVNLFCAEGDGDVVFSGDDSTVQCAYWGTTLEALRVATSYISTGAATASRVADSWDIDLPGDIGIERGELVFSTYDHDCCGATVWALAVSNTGAGTDELEVSVGGTNLTVYTTQTAGNALSLTADEATYDYADGTLHTINFGLMTDNANVFFDGSTSVTADASYDPGPNLDSVQIGSTNSNSGQLNGHVKRVTLWGTK